jgi:hypothetical protein
MWYNEPMKHIIQFTVTKDEGVYTCACRKSNPDVLVMQTAQNGAGNDAVPVGNLIRLASEAESRNVSIL